MQLKLKPVQLSILAALCISFGSQAAETVQDLTVLRATELRADKIATSEVVTQLAAGTALQVLSIEGGWVLAQVTKLPGSPQKGWIRASALNWPTDNSAVSAVASGRQATGNKALTLGVRSLKPVANPSPEVTP